MRIVGDVFTFLTFFFLPFLGGNHLPLFYVSIDRFWIETIFGVCLVISVMLRYHEKREGANRVHQVCRLLSSLCPLERNKSVLFMEQVQHPHQLEYSGMGSGRCLSFPPVTKKGTLSSQVLWPAPL